MNGVQQAISQVTQMDLYKTVCVLLKEEGNLNTADNYGKTLLHIAASKGYFKTLKFLIKNGANLEAYDNHGWTPLRSSIYEGHFQIAKFLIVHGANINSLDCFGWSLLHEAVFKKNFKIVKFLVAKGAKVDLVDNSNRTPLHEAFFLGYFKIMKFLITKAANLDVLDRDGESLFHETLAKNHFKLAKFLIKQGVNLNACNKSGSTPLHIALRRGLLELTTFLVKNGANPNVLDKSGKMPLQLMLHHSDHIAMYCESQNDFKTTACLLLLSGAECQDPDQLPEEVAKFKVRLQDLLCLQYRLNAEQISTYLRYIFLLFLYEKRIKTYEKFWRKNISFPKLIIGFHKNRFGAYQADQNDITFLCMISPFHLIKALISCDPYQTYLKLNSGIKTSRILTKSIESKNEGWKITLTILALLSSFTLKSKKTLPLEIIFEIIECLGNLYRREAIEKEVFKNFCNIDLSKASLVIRNISYKNFQQYSAYSDYQKTLPNFL